MKLELQDNLICSTCKGKKIIPNPLTENIEICPVCKGKGILGNTIEENSNKNKKLLLENR